jgi:hypothetical protein
MLGVRSYTAVAAVVAMIASTVPSPVFAAAKPVALVLDSTQDVATKVPAFSEVAAGQTIDLGTDGEVELVHYTSCRTTRIRGGVVKIGVQKADVSATEVVSDSPSNCPNFVKVSSSGVAGGVMVRNAFAVPMVVSKACVVLGKAVDHVAVKTEAGDIIMQVPVQGHRVVWPDHGAGFTYGQSYVLAFSQGAQPLAEILVQPQAAKPAPKSNSRQWGAAPPQDLCILRVQ